MWLKIALVALILSGIALADDQKAYDMLKVEIQEKKRTLGHLHQLRDYPEAMKVQKEIAELSRRALETALKSPDIGDSWAWSRHANVLRDAGYLEEALEALDEYMQTPMLDRNGLREGWKRRAGIHKKQKEFEQAEKAYRKALTYSDGPREEFYLRRDLVNLYLKEGASAEAAGEAEKLVALLNEIEPERKTAAERDYQSLMVKVYKETGDGPAARKARYRELELKKELVEKELAEFDTRYPEE